MKHWKFHSVAACICIPLAALSIWLGSVALASATADSHIADAKGEATINGTFLQVTLDRPVIKTCGDTEILVFLSLDNGLEISLDPTFIPKKKNQEMSMNKSFFFSLLKAVPFLGDGEHEVEIFVTNNCSMWSQSIALAPLPLTIGEGV